MFAERRVVPARHTKLIEFGAHARTGALRTAREAQRATEQVRLDEAREQESPWRKWRPSLSERQWALFGRITAKIEVHPWSQQKNGDCKRLEIAMSPGGNGVHI